MAGNVIQGYFPRGIRHLGTVQQHPAAMRLPPHVAPFATAGGRPLDAAVRQRMETFFGARFDDVRVHEGPHVSGLGALAFARGSHIHFAPGQYDPSTARGSGLLARQLAHVVQQRSGRVQNPFSSGIAVVADRRLDAEAEQFALRAAALAPAMARHVPVVRQARAPLRITVPTGRIVQRIIPRTATRAGMRPRQVVQRLPIIPDGMEPDRHLDGGSAAGDFTDFEDNYVLVPATFLELYNAALSPDERASTLVRFSTLMAILDHSGPAGHGLVAAYNGIAPGPAKLVALSAVAAAIDATLGRLLTDYERQRINHEHQRIPVELNDTFLIVRFHNFPTGTNCMVRASMLRHGIWNMEDSHAEELNSVLLPGAQGQLEQDGRDLGAQLARANPYHGAGRLYRVSSGREYEVDGVSHFFPVRGPDVAPLTRKQYLTLRAIILLFQTYHGSRIRDARDAEEFIEDYDAPPDELSSALSQIRLVGFGIDPFVDDLVERFVKPYRASSITALMEELNTVCVSMREFGEARARRQRRKARDAEDRERVRNQPTGGAF
jgi:hypothetical protein